MRTGRTSLRILVWIMFLAIVLPLGAASLRIGFLSYDPALSGQRFSTQLLDLASRALDAHPVAAAHEQPMRLRIASERELERLRSQPDTLPGTESPSEEIELSIDAVELVALQVSTDIAAKVIADDRIVSEYLLARNGLDMLLICAIEPFDEFLRTRLMVLRRGETTFTSLFDRIAKPADLAGMLDQALLAISTLVHGRSLGLVSFGDMVPGLDVSVDGVRGSLVGDALLLAPGDYLLTFSAPGHEGSSRMVNSRPGAITIVNVDLPRVSGPPLLLTSRFPRAFVTIPAGPSGPLPLIWASQSAPFVIQAETGEGRPATVQVTRPTEHIELSFEVPWMDEHVVGRYQRTLYGSLGRTLLLGAMAIVFESIESSLFSSGGGSGELQPLVLASLGAAGVSAVDTVLRLFAYYQKTKYSSL